MSLAVYKGNPARFRIGTIPEGFRMGIPNGMIEEVLLPLILRFVPLDLRTGST